jgi:hypothetical protein
MDNVAFRSEAEVVWRTVNISSERLTQSNTQ